MTGRNGGEGGVEAPAARIDGMRHDAFEPETETPVVFRLALASAPVLHRPDGSALPLSLRDAALLAWLALEGPTPRTRLAQLLWPDSDSEAARNALRQRLFHLRRQAGDGLVVGTAMLSLAAGVEHDLDDADSVLAEARHDFGAELAAWLEQQRLRRRARTRQSLVDFSDMAAQAGDHADALLHAHELLALEPLSEEAHRRVMRLHYLAGDRAAALLAFDRCERMLKDEVGTRPSAETLALLGTLERADGAGLPAARQPVPAGVLRPPRLVGREAEWLQMQSTWDDGGVLLLSAEGGMGKSRLLGDFAAARGQAQGRVLLFGARPGDRLLPYALLGRCLRGLVAWPGLTLAPGVRGELARLLPELGDAAALTEGADRTRFVNAVETTLRQAAAQGLEGLLVDDLHLADEASAELLLQLCADPALRWLVAFRAPELQGAGQRFVDALTVSRLAQLRVLAPLTVAQVQELLESLALDGWDVAAQAVQLHRRTGGNPMYLLETVKAILCGAVVPQGHDAALPAVPSVSQVILRRLGVLPAPAVKLARCAAVAGQDFSAALAASVMGVQPLDLADTWNQLEEAQVLRDGAFAHDLIYEAALASVPAPIARELHLQIARFLESRASDPARVATHWVAGGDPLRAVPHWRAAAALSAQRFRYLEAMQCHEAAARILEAEGDHHGAFASYFAAADALGTLGSDERMQAFAVKLTALADDDGEVAQAALVQVSVLAEAGRLDEAMSHALAALAPAHRAGTTEIESELLYIVGVIHWERREIAEAVAQVERALKLRRALAPEARRIDHTATLITVTQALGAMLGGAGRFSESVTLVEEAYQLALEARQPHHMLGSAAELCYHAMYAGDLARALEWSERGMQALTAPESNKGDQARLLMARAQALMLAGHWGAALAQHEELLQSYARPPNRRSGDIVIRAAQFHHLVGRRDLALKLLRDEAMFHQAPAVLRLNQDVTLCAIGEPADAGALLERVAALEDVGLRARLLVRLVLRCEPEAALPTLNMATSLARDAGQHGVALSLQSRGAALLAIAGRHDEAAAAARQAWQLHEAGGRTPMHTLPEVLADLCRALTVQEHALAQRLQQQAEAWLVAASATLPVGWRDNCLARSPLRVTL